VDHISKKAWKQAHEDGCVTKCRTGKKAYVKGGHAHAYRSNGHTEAKSKATGIYDVDFTLAANMKRLTAILGKSYSEKAHGKGVRRKTADPRDKRDAWFLSTGNNFQKGYKPYNHDSHHMVPCEALAECFDPSERLLLMQAKYNVNLGGNVIILPKKEKIGQALKLPIHYSNHSQYSIFVMTQLQNIRFEITEAKNKHEVTKNNKDKVRDAIVTLEPDLWALLVRLGAAAALANTAADLEQFDTLMRTS
jgi:A nuclease family of the HNH/ENDO VII superfamily with conserved AHH